MGKQKAKQLVESGALTWGQLKAAIAASHRTGISTLNPSLTKEQVLDIFERAIADRPDDVTVVAFVPDRFSSYPGAMKHGRDFLTASNICRECL